MAGLPQVMRMKREQMRAQHPEQVVEQAQPERVMIPIDVPALKPNEGGDPNLPPHEVASVEEEPKPLSLEDQWKATAEKWETKYRSLQGSIERIEPELRSERELRTRLEQQMQELREAMPRPEPVLDPSEELTEDELKVYGESSAVVQKIARKVARGELASALKDLKQEIAQLKEANGRVETGVAQSEEERFVDSVKRNVKNFDAIIKSSEWVDYLSQRVPYTKDTISSALDKAHAKRDLDSVLEIFQGFKPSKAALESMKSPVLNGGAAPVNANGQRKPILKLSDRKKVSEDFRKGRIDKATLDTWNKLFREAEAEGRLDLAN